MRARWCCPTSPFPALKVRRAETVVELPSGGSLVMAGLLSDQSKQALSGYPGLKNLPVLGTLFRSRDFLKNETELVVLVTPYVVKPVARAAARSARRRLRLGVGREHRSDRPDEPRLWPPSRACAGRQIRWRRWLYRRVGDGGVTRSWYRHFTARARFGARPLLTLLAVLAVAPRAGGCCQSPRLQGALHARQSE